jgi:hypothetical protein
MLVLAYVLTLLDLGTIHFKYQDRIKHCPIIFQGMIPGTAQGGKRTKSKGLPINVLLYPYTFYTRNSTYKKQGNLDRHPVLLLYFLYA